ncbi:MAG: alcohol dehydrogenase catalytic domain-containing protein [Clostridia bacterium]|nr:alcohol dehydrogenase catalytic domain-containing protein [Clostridia bacterium]
MDNWVLKGPKMLENQKQCESEVDATQVKVRVSHILVSNYDALTYTGATKIAYPKTLGRIAIGIVTEAGENCYGVTKGARVYLNAMRPCGKCYACKSGNRGECTSPLVAGQDFDGFMRDFVVCDYTDVSVIPDSVDDFLALCIENVALAENIYDKLNLSTGSRVAIVGGGFLGSVLAQIALYHKLVPIVIDNYAKNVERLQKSGVYFTFSADDTLASNIENATSGNMCDAAIYTSCCKLSPSVPASVLASHKDMVLGGFCTVNFTMDTAPLFEKNLRVYSVSDGFGYTETAINMLVHGALDLSHFEKEVLTEFNLPALLTERAEKFSQDSKMVVLKLIL